MRRTPDFQNTAISLINNSTRISSLVHVSVRADTRAKNTGIVGDIGYERTDKF